MSDSRTSDRGSKSHRRSNSVSALDRSRDNRRVPAVNLDRGKDLPELICTMLASTLLVRPEVATGTFFKTSRNAIKDIVLSDATLLISAAILNHLESSKNAGIVLSKSNTVTGYYNQLGLMDKSTRELFVTMMFSLNPAFKTMVEATMMISISRSADVHKAASTGTTVAAVAGTLRGMDLITDNESAAVSGACLPTNQKEPSTHSVVLPSDSVSMVGARLATSDQPRFQIDETDLLEFAKRRRRGAEPSFKEVFPSSKDPPEPDVSRAYSRHGLGYAAPQNMSTMRLNNLAGLVNQGIGVMSNNITNAGRVSGKLASTQPAFSEHPDETLVSPTVFKTTPSLATDEDFSYVGRGQSMGKPRGDSAPADDEVDEIERLFLASLGL